MLEKCEGNQNNKQISKDEKINGCKDALVLLLDKELGHTVTDNDIFWVLPRYWEGKYFEDMKFSSEIVCVQSSLILGPS